MSQDLGYDIVLPSHLLLNENLEANAKLFYGVIRNLTRHHGYCYASNNYLAKQMNVKERMVRNWLESLEKEGYIKRSFDDTGSKRHIELSFEFQEKNRMAKNCHPPGKKLPPPPAKNCHQKEDNRKKIINSSKQARKRPSPAAPAAASIEEQIRSSRIPSDKQEAAINYYRAFKDEVDKKKNPVGWIVNMYDIGKIDAMEEVVQQELREVNQERENFRLASIVNNKLSGRNDVKSSISEVGIIIEFPGGRRCGGRYDSPHFKTDVLGGLISAGFVKDVLEIDEEWEGSKEDSIFNKILQLKYVKSEK